MFWKKSPLFPSSLSFLSILCFLEFRFSLSDGLDDSVVAPPFFAAT